ncbi:MAG: hypothetical protein IPO10_01555 [Flavobacteriales bacterium]|nr:hypothetical protein [Flavobacteriales bacterium]
MKGHAAHNEAACDLLNTSGTFPDWVITTAFYSALHLVYEKLFPLTEKGETLNSFDQYFGSRYARKGPGDKPSKHEATVDLVKSHLPGVASYYRLLKDSCHNARYRSYVVKPYEATVARNQLQNIKAGLAKRKGK